MPKQPVDDEFDAAYGDWDIGHPYAWRIWFRVRLPMVLIDLGIADKGKHCIHAGGWHRWYEKDSDVMACYHCHQTKRNDSLSGVIVDAEQAL